ncbi:MAG: hypothetical protein OXI73_04125 [Rhodospirillales bacterium]|nr:hypothetical protein [Rhodospirillales bacterium]
MKVVQGLIGWAIIGFVVWVLWPSSDEAPDDTLVAQVAGGSQEQQSMHCGSVAGYPPCEIENGGVGCTSEDRLSEIMGYVTTRDEQAFRTAMTAYMATGECTIFEEGDTVHVVDQTVWTQRANVRRAGEVATYWIPRAYIWPVD